MHDSAVVTARSLGRDLRSLGVLEGSTLLVHSSLSALGWVCGGAHAVVTALETAVGTTGTLVMPTFSGQLSDPATWRNPPAPREWWDTIREELPAYDEARTATRGMGAVAECFRTGRDVLRSPHPQNSFAASGPKAAHIVGEHALDHRFGDGSPLARIYDVDGWVLLLGIGFAKNTSFHLAENRADYAGRRTLTRSVPVPHEGRTRWTTCADIELYEEDFEPMGRWCLDRLPEARTGKVGDAEAVLFPQRPFVDLAVDWLLAHRVLETVA